MRYLKTSGEKIKAARRSAGLTQTQLGEKMGVTGSMIGQYETETRHPSLKTASIIAEILGVDVSQLMDEYENDDAALASSKKYFFVSFRDEDEDIAPFVQAVRASVAGEKIDARTLEDLKTTKKALENDTLLHASSIKSHADVAIQESLKNLDDCVIQLCHDKNAATDVQKLRELEFVPARIGNVIEFIKANSKFLKQNMPGMIPNDNPDR